MVVIDFHTHILPPSFGQSRAALAARDATFAELFARKEPLATTEQLVQAMDQDGVDTSVVVGYGWCDQTMARESNDYLLDAARRFPGRIIPFCSVNPAWGDAALIEVERCITLGARGIGELHPTSQGIDLALDRRLEPFMEMATQHGLPVLVHGSEPVGHLYPGKGRTTPEVLLAFIQRFPGATIICAHWGGGLPFYALMPEVLKSLSNAYFDTAASPFLYRPDVFPIAARSIGPEHILFASDYPLLRASRVIKQAKAALAGEPDAVLERILAGNARKVLGLRAPGEVT